MKPLLTFLALMLAALVPSRAEEIPCSRSL